MMPKSHGKFVQNLLGCVTEANLIQVRLAYKVGANEIINNFNKTMKLQTCNVSRSISIFKALSCNENTL